jgi:hypothetical protein
MVPRAGLDVVAKRKIPVPARYQILLVKSSQLLSWQLSQLPVDLVIAYNSDDDDNDRRCFFLTYTSFEFV